jgi:hypothetical protein
VDQHKQIHSPVAYKPQTAGNERKPRLSDVDELADLLVESYGNSDYRQWYCKVIYEFGVQRVLEWYKRAESGREPGKVFTTYVNQARTVRKLKQSLEYDNET